MNTETIKSFAYMSVLFFMCVAPIIIMNYGEYVTYTMNLLYAYYPFFIIIIGFLLFHALGSSKYHLLKGKSFFFLFGKKPMIVRRTNTIVLSTQFLRILAIGMIIYGVVLLS